MMHITLFTYISNRMGLKKNLTAAEIVEQVIFAQRLLTSDVGSITNVVFMVSLLLTTILSQFSPAC